jgi:hypothetical protein
MTLTKVLTMALRRAGLSTSTTGTYWTPARDYFNLGMMDLTSRGNWVWLRTKSSALTITAADNTDELASDVLHPLDFYDKTNNTKIWPLSEARVHDLDPDENSSGPIRFWSPTGTGSNGYFEVTWSPIPDAADSVFYTYRSMIADKTSSNDATDLLASMPLWAQHALIFYVAGFYKGEKGDLHGEAQDMSNYDRRVVEALIINDKAVGHTRHRMTKRQSRSRQPAGNVPLTFTIVPGSL